MDRIDMFLFVLPILPVADLLSTLYSLRFGGEEIGILARPILETYGSNGLVVLMASGSAIFLTCIWVVVHMKKLFISELRFRWMWYVLAIPIYWLFMLEGVYFSTVVINFLVGLAPVLSQVFVLRFVLACSYFGCVSLLTMRHMKQLPHS